MRNYPIWTNEGILEMGKPEFEHSIHFETWYCIFLNHLTPLIFDISPKMTQFWKIDRKWLNFWNLTQNDSIFDIWQKITQFWRFGKKWLNFGNFTKNDWIFYIWPKNYSNLEIWPKNDSSVSKWISFLQTHCLLP